MLINIIMYTRLVDPCPNLTPYPLYTTNKPRERPITRRRLMTSCRVYELLFCGKSRTRIHSCSNCNGLAISTFFKISYFIAIIFYLYRCFNKSGIDLCYITFRVLYMELYFNFNGMKLLHYSNS